jgi:hypothetical protein
MRTAYIADKGERVRIATSLPLASQFTLGPTAESIVTLGNSRSASSGAQQGGFNLPLPEQHTLAVKGGPAAPAWGVDRVELVAARAVAATEQFTNVFCVPVSKQTRMICWSPPFPSPWALRVPSTGCQWGRAQPYSGPHSLRPQQAPLQPRVHQSGWYRLLSLASAASLEPLLEVRHHYGVVVVRSRCCTIINSDSDTAPSLSIHGTFTLRGDIMLSISGYAMTVSWLQRRRSVKTDESAEDARSLTLVAQAARVSYEKTLRYGECADGNLYGSS